MADIQLTFEPSLEELGRKFKSINTNSFLRTKIKSLAFMVEKESKRNAPVDTGRLRSSIFTSYQDAGETAIIRPDAAVNYAGFVHEGTKFMKGRPFMARGLQTALEGFVEKLAKELDTEIQAKLR